ncbi:ribonuclease P protein component [Arthrobacter sp. JZ12]|uniref:ribonuclease P protein component n=1 Tax=Arthrobacter sp. JZ12 TaxID=2654190 RepID=UPI002B465DF7|nr:ribonuclease P protein component [Arthrobacter sp. JZ12]WRH26296.1 ribonuclease P protein component [Arthrobacter sp. JZ12]
MLSTAHRVRTAKDFSHTVRSGARSGCRNLVLYAVGTGTENPSRFGFIVSKNVGNAVTRNLVKRRLREAAAAALVRRPLGLDVVVRALPSSASAGWPELSSDFERCLASSAKRSIKNSSGRTGDGT